MKKFTSLMLTALLLITVCVPLGADDAAPVVTFTAESVTVNAENIANYRQADGSYLVPVSVTAAGIPANNGVAAFTFTVSSTAEIASVTAGADVSNPDQFQVGPNNAIVFVDTNEITAENAQIAVVTLSVPHEVAAGNEYGVSLTASSDPDDFLLIDVTNYTPSVVNGSVSFAVGGHDYVDGICSVCGDRDEAFFAPKVYIPSQTVSPGDTAELTIGLENNPGMAAIAVRINFDPDVFVIGDPDNWEDWIYTDRTGVRLTLVTVNAYSTPGEIVLVFGQATDTVRDGELVTIELDVAPDAAPGNYEFGVVVQQCINADKANVTVDAVNGIITVESSIVYGDASGDGVVDLVDLIYIAQYIADNTIVLPAGADADGNGIIDLVDVILVAQYIADNSIILGPQA